jgi:G3E family GTPase
MKSKLIIVGGFLGSGKTTLLSQTAKILKEQGEKSRLNYK